MIERNSQVSIIGAGPYGLATASYLREAGQSARVFGQPMEFWQTQMPRGMLLRSSRYASHIPDPKGELTLDAFDHERSHPAENPVPLETFVEYGQWYGRHAAPDLDRRTVRAVDRAATGFTLELEDGERIAAQSVVIAAGIAPFARRPNQFAGLPPELASHASDHADLGKFAGRQVLVLGGGQSALESAALLSESGAEVEVVMRRQHVIWLKRRTRHIKNQVQGRLERFIDPPTDVGPLGLSWIAAKPDLFRLMPRPVQDRIAYRCIRPAGARWLPARLQNVRITTGRTIASATANGPCVDLVLDDGTARSVDHLFMATGYRIDVARYPFFGPSVLNGLRRENGYPILGRGLEASVPGLYFAGAPAAWSFGPLLRFVVGATYAAPAIARHIAR